MRDNPEKIETLQFEIAETNRSIQNERGRIDVFEADLTIEIHTEKGADGKPFFSNDTTRKAAFVKRCAEDADYTILNNGLQKLESDRLKMAARLERLRLEFKLFLLDRQAEIEADCA